MRDRIPSLPELPAGWLWTKLGEACSNEKDRGIEGYIPYLEIGNVDIYTKKYSPGVKPAVKGALLAKEGDILVSRVRPTRGAVTIICEKEIQVSSAFTVLRPLAEIPPEYIHYFLAWNRTFLDFLGENSTGTMYPTVKEDFVVQYPIPLSPLPEQHRISTKVDELFTRLDAGIKMLEKVDNQVKLYRQAVLKYALEGKLTEKWRKAQRGEIEPAHTILKRIREQRKISGKEKRKESCPAELSDSHMLPEGWAWATIDDIIETLTDYHANGSYKVLKAHVRLLEKPDYAIMVRTTNLENNDFEYSLKYISEAAYSFLQKSKLFGEEIIIGKIGNAGKVYWMPKLNRPCSLGMNLFLLRFHIGISSRYVYFHLMSTSSAEQIRLYVKGVGNPTIDKKSIRSLRIALPPFLEQLEIVKEVERQFSVADVTEQVVGHSLKRAERLRQSILKRAFEGKLVLQDPTDEPAEKLLEHIRAERARIEAEKKATGKTRNKLNTVQGRLM